MNAENLFLGLFVLAAAYGFIMTILFMSRNAMTLRIQEEFTYLKADHAQLSQINKELLEKEFSDE